MNLKPYHYLHHHKVELEKEMLEMGIIRPSHFSYASPTLVRKKDDTLRMCIDYRRLNSMIVKDKFPIPIIDDLLDELIRAIIFTKLDLRSDYYQIKMHEADIERRHFACTLGAMSFW